MTPRRSPLNHPALHPAGEPDDQTSECDQSRTGMAAEELDPVADHGLEGSNCCDLSDELDHLRVPSMTAGRVADEPDRAGSLLRRSRRDLDRAGPEGRHPSQSVEEPEHGAATLTRSPAGWWTVECHDCPWTSGPHTTDMAAEHAWYEHAGPIPSGRTHEQVAA